MCVCLPSGGDDAIDELKVGGCAPQSEVLPNPEGMMCEMVIEVSG